MIVNNITLEIFGFVLRKIVLIVLRVICAAAGAGNLILLISPSWPVLLSPSAHSDQKKTLLKMTLALFHAFQDPSLLAEGQSLCDWLLNTIELENYTSKNVTNSFVTELCGHVYIKKSRHEVIPRTKLTRENISHILCFMVCRLKIEEVTESILRGIWKRMPKKDSRPDEPWEGIKFITDTSGRTQGEGTASGASGTFASELSLFLIYKSTFW